MTETGPCLDGDLFPESLDVLRARATPKPFITGVTKEEGLLMSRLYLLFYRYTDPKGS